MNNTSTADRTAEAELVREEFTLDADGVRALDHLAREDQGTVDLPPVPEDLRDEWKRRFGRETAVAKEKVSWFAKLPVWFRPLAPVLPVALVAALIFLRPGAETESVSDDAGVILRDQGTFAPAPDTVTFFISSEEISFEQLSATRAADSVIGVQSHEQALELIKARGLSAAVIVDARSGTLRTYPATDEISLVPDASTADEYDLSEAIDDFLSQ